ncbi:MAG TPA: hypothetical protein GXZ24_06230 [Firmicutes bacterium]|nr:hypothetical protein [Bacillota bacterium]
MFIRKRASTTSKVLIGLGRFSKRLGKTVGGKIGAGIVGFGLAHILLGSLAKLRSGMRFR